jgi:uncharacterized protein
MAATRLFSQSDARGWIPWGLLAPVIGLVFVAAPVLATDGLFADLGFVDAMGAPIGLQGLLVFLLIPFFLMSLLVLAWTRLVERRSLASIGLGLPGARRSFVRGLVLGLATILSVVAAIFLFGGYKIGAVAAALHQPTSLPAILALLACFIVQASSEELLFRGWLMSAVARRINLPVAVLLTSALFTLLHFSRGQFWVVTLGTFMFSLFACCWAIKANNIWGVMGWHSGWNWLLAVGFELPVTGIDAHVPAILLKLTPQGSDVLTGGAEGPEGSYLCVLLLAIWSAFLIWRILRQRPKPTLAA